MRKLLSSGDPELAPNSQHTAHALMTNITAREWTYNAELYLVKAGTKYTSSGTITFSLAAGASQTIDFPIAMPAAEGIYEVYLDISAEGVFIRGYIATEDVTVQAVSPPPMAGDFEYSNLNLAIHTVPGDPYGRWSEVSCDVKNVTDHALTMEVAVWLQAGYYWSEFIKQIYDSFSNWEEWAKPSGTWNAGTIDLTLAPGETFHFHYGGPAAYDDFNDVYLEDSSGGKSNTVRAYD